MVAGRQLRRPVGGKGRKGRIPATDSPLFGSLKPPLLVYQFFPAVAVWVGSILSLANLLGPSCNLVKKPFVLERPSVQWEVNSGHKEHDKETHRRSLHWRSICQIGNQNPMINTATIATMPTQSTLWLMPTEGQQDQGMGAPVLPAITITIGAIPKRQS